MLAATEHQLELIAARASKLEASVNAQVEGLRALADERSRVRSEVAEVRAKLQMLEKREVDLNTQHEVASEALKAGAVEFDKTQLLAKKYRNTVADLKGQCKAYIAVESEIAGLLVPDECTVEVENEAVFCFDGVVASEKTMDPASKFGLRQAVKESVEGYNTSFITFGPSCDEKAAVMLGTSGVVRSFTSTLFDSLVELEVTHFSMRCSFGELHQDQFIDHLADFGHTLALGASSDIRSLPVQSVDEAMQYVDMGMQRLRATHRQQGHVFYALSIESFNRAGHFRKGSALFVDVASPQQGSAGVAQAPEAQWLSRSVSSLCNAIAIVAAAGADGARSVTLPNSTIVRLLHEAFGGNCKATMISVLSGRSSLDEVVSTLTYASHFKTMHNQPAPYDIPAELQRLNLEASA